MIFTTSQQVINSIQILRQDLEKQQIQVDNQTQALLQKQVSQSRIKVQESYQEYLINQINARKQQFSKVIIKDKQYLITQLEKVFKKLNQLQQQDLSDISELIYQLSSNFELNKLIFIANYQQFELCLKQNDNCIISDPLPHNNINQLLSILYINYLQRISKNEVTKKTICITTQQIVFKFADMTIYSYESFISSFINQSSNFNNTQIILDLHSFNNQFKDNIIQLQIVALLEEMNKNGCRTIIYLPQQFERSISNYYSSYQLIQLTYPQFLAEPTVLPLSPIMQNNIEIAANKCKEIINEFKNVNPTINILVIVPSISYMENLALHLKSIQNLTVIQYYTEFYYTKKNVSEIYLGQGSNVLITTTRQIILNNKADINNFTALIDFGLIEHSYFDIQKGLYVRRNVAITDLEKSMRQHLLVLSPQGRVFTFYNSSAAIKTQSKQNIVQTNEDISLEVLRALALKIDLNSFLFQQCIPKESILQALDLLLSLKLIKENNIVTKQGYQIIEYPIEPIITINIKKSLFSILGVLKTPGSLFSTEKSQQFFKKQTIFTWNNECDAEKWNIIIKAFKEMKKNKKEKNKKKQKKNKSKQDQKISHKEWCKENNLNLYKVEYAYDFQKYLNDKYNQLLIQNQQKGEDSTFLEEDITTCFYNSTAVFLSIKDGYNILKLNTAFKQTLSCYQRNQGNNFFLVNIMELQEQDINGKLLINAMAKTSPLSLKNNAPEEFCSQFKDILFKRQSVHQAEIEFFGISSTLFNYFWEKEPQTIQNFEENFNCFVEAVQSLEQVRIHIEQKNKEEAEKEFTQILEKAKQSLISQKIEVPYLENQKYMLQKGGTIQSFVNINQNFNFTIKNLPLQVTKQQLVEWLDEYTEIIDIHLSNGPDQSMQAEVILDNPQDVIFFEKFFDQTQYLGKTIQVAGSSDKNKNKFVIVQEEICMKVKWFQWQSKCKGVIKYKYPISQNSKDQMKQLATTEVDAKKIKIDFIDNEQTVTLTNLNKTTDELYLRKIFQGFGIIEDIIVERIQDIDRGDFKESVKYIIDQFSKERSYIEWIKLKKDGLRVAKVHLVTIKGIQRAINNINNETNILGHQRTYAAPYLVHNYYIDNNILKAVQQSIQNDKELKPLLDTKKIKFKQFSTKENNHQSHLQFICRDHTIFQTIKKQLNQLLEGQPLGIDNCNIIFSEIGQQKLKQLEQKFQCVFKLNYAHQNDKLQAIKVISSLSDLLLIQKEIQNFLQNKIEIQIKLSKTNFKIVESQVDQIKKQFNLAYINLQGQTKMMEIYGLPESIVQINNALSSGSLAQENSLMKASSITCEICCSQMQNCYRLLQCSHRFCLNCLINHVQYCLNTIDCFPIKCPQCPCEMTLSDIGNLITQEDWKKLYRQAINNYVSLHKDTITFCLTAECPSLIQTKLIKYSCAVCQKTYCSKCKVEYHFGQTCEEYKDNNLQKLKEYMEQNDVRFCPNENCKALLVRIDGCYRVQCCSCKKHICWKDKCMLFYDQAQQCYDHLTEKHGGYW